MSKVLPFHARPKRDVELTLIEQLGLPWVPDLEPITINAFSDIPEAVRRIKKNKFAPKLKIFGDEDITLEYRAKHSKEGYSESVYALGAGGGVIATFWIVCERL